MTVRLLALGVFLALASAYVGGDLGVPPCFSAIDAAPPAEPAPAPEAPKSEPAPPEGGHAGPPPQEEKPDAVTDAESCRKALLARKISVDLKGVPLGDALEMLASAAGVGLTVDGHIEADKLAEPVDLKLDRSSVYAVLHWVFYKRDFAWAVRGREILVAPPGLMDPDVATKQNEFAGAAEDAWMETARPKFEKTKLSVDVSGVTVDEVAEIIAQRAGVGLFWAPGTEKLRTRPVEFKLEKTSLLDLLEKLSASSDLDWDLQAEALVFSPK